jgi:hypothetical protein
MPNHIERTITFEPFIPLPTNGNYGSVRFRIEPPIDVHDPKFLENAVNRTPGNKYANGAFDLVAGVDVTYSDPDSTHGRIDMSRPAKPETFQRVMTEAFISELALGGTVLHLVFPESNS